MRRPIPTTRAGHPYLNDALDTRRSRHRRWSDALVDQAAPLWIDAARLTRIPEHLVGDVLAEGAVRESIDHLAEMSGLVPALDRAVASLHIGALHGLLTVVEGSLATAEHDSFRVVTDYLSSVARDLAAHRTLKDDLDERALRGLPVLIVLLQVAEQLATGLTDCDRAGDESAEDESAEPGARNAWGAQR